MSDENRFYDSLDKGNPSLRDETTKDIRWELSTQPIVSERLQVRTDKTDQAGSIEDIDNREIRFSLQRRKRAESEESVDYQRRERKPVGWKFQRLN